jgi:hypothetical protein
MISSYNVSKSIAFVSGSVQKQLNSKHLFRHCMSSSCRLQSLSICLSIQKPASCIRYDHSDLFNNTLTSSDLMRIYRPQYTDRVWRQSSSSCTSFFGISFLNVTRMNHYIWFRTTLREEVTMFICGVGCSSRKMLTYLVLCLFRK